MFNSSNKQCCKCKLIAHNEACEDAIIVIFGGKPHVPLYPEVWNKPDGSFSCDEYLVYQVLHA